MSNKNILLATRPLTPPWDEASKNFAYFLAKSITDPELRLHILTTYSPSPARGEGRGEVGAPLILSDNVIPHPIYPANDENHAGFPLSQKIRIPLYLLAHGHEYDIIHYLFTPTKLNAFITKHFVSKKPKTIQTIATLREDILTPADWQELFFADQLVVYSDYSKNKLEKAGFKNVQRVYPGIDLEKYSPRPKDPEAMHSLNIAPEDFVILHNGEYTRLGATDMLVAMLVKHLHFSPSSEPNLTPTLSSAQERGKLKFIFGNRLKNDADKKKKAEVVERLTQAGVIDSVRFTDTWKDMPTLYNLADVIVFPAGDMKGKFDIPLAIIEPYACAKPVILSDLEIFREFSKPEFSVTIPAGDGEKLWQAIEDLQADEAKRKILGVNARLFTEQFFNLEMTAKDYENRYKTI
ncbi:MAG: glycosyltransferase family 4 protein [Candidatus Moraniibacteriota bacterium]